ncbi:MAG: hypothetical protein ACK5MF_09335, partial [Vibrio sp.]|uniref:hypothetical protein n=1 Tax=Vibrio sp. TaxID=678 RepID=UPI003A8B4991
MWAIKLSNHFSSSHSFSFEAMDLIRFALGSGVLRQSPQCLSAQASASSLLMRLCNMMQGINSLLRGIVRFSKGFITEAKQPLAGCGYALVELFARV